MDYRIEQLRYQLREDPSSRQFYQLGELLRRDGEFDEAVEVLERGLEVHSRYVAAWVSLGRALLEQERPTDAEGAFAQALELDPQNAVAARMLGEAAEQRGDWARARKALQLARALSPRDPGLEDSLARVSERLAEQGEAPAMETMDTVPMPAVFAFADDAEVFAETPPEPAPEARAEESLDDVFASDEPMVAEAEPPAQAEQTIPEAEEEAPPPVEAATAGEEPAQEAVEEPAEEAVDEAAEVMEEPAEATVASMPAEGAAVFEEPQPPPPPLRPLDVVTVFDDDPFAAEAGGDTGVWQLADDVFSEPPESAEQVVEEEVGPFEEHEDVVEPPSAEDEIAVAEAVPAAEMEMEREAQESALLPAETGPFPPEPEVEERETADLLDQVAEPAQAEAPAELEAEGLPADDELPLSAAEEAAMAETGPLPVLSAEAVEAAASAVVVEAPPEPEMAPPPEPALQPEPEPEMPEAALDETTTMQIPLPTLTLARLALQQGDRDLAESTVLRVLERRPDDADAAELLGLIRGEAVDPAAVRIAALQGWLERIRLAAERQAP